MKTLFSYTINSFLFGKIVLFFCLIYWLSSCKSNENAHSIKQRLVLDPCLDSLPMDEEKYRLVYDSIGAKDKIYSLDTLLAQTHGQGQLNGCILVSQAGVILHQKCYGTTCLSCQEKEAITPKSIFQLASLSKTFTAVAILKLIEERKISLSDSIQQYYPNFPYKDINIQMLLSHRSGLPNYIYAFEDSSRTCQYPDNQTIMQWFENEKPNIYYYPNRKFAYSNTNYVILASIIEKISGESYQQYMETHIFSPLKMYNTSFYKELPPNPQNTKGHEGTNTIAKDFFDEVAGDKGIYSTMDDLVKWHKSLKYACLLSQQSLQLAFTPQSFEEEGVRNYGLGFRLTLDTANYETQYIYHNGWWKGYNSLFWFSPKSESFVILLCNVKNKELYKIKPIIAILENLTEIETPQEDQEE